MNKIEERHPSLNAIRQHVRAAVAALSILVLGIGGLMASVELSGAVVAPGTVIVESHLKKVQHPTGGVVGEITVQDGMRVKAGDVVMRLDETVTAANLGIVTNGLDELAARQARLQAERDGALTPAFPAELLSRIDTPAVAELVGGEQRLFEARRDARDGQQRQLRERVAQTKQQINGLVQQAASKIDEIALIESELVAVEELFAKQLIPLPRIMALRREKTRLQGERGQLVSGIAQAKARISETELQILQIDQDLRSEVSRDLREAQAKSAELAERKVAAEDQLKRIDIHAPQAGIVHQLAIHTIGGVVTPGESIMMIVPEADDLIIEAKVGLDDIDQVRLGQSVVLRLSALNQRTTPELTGTVAHVPADLVTDQRSGVQYYPIRIAIDPKERNRLGTLKLIPGMPAESFIQTGDRSILSYLAKPLADQTQRAFKHE
jgi:HlyD family secretion protein